MKRTVRYTTRRMRQTFTVFENGPRLVRALVGRSEEITFHTRNGLEISVPNVAGAKFPVYEIHGDDVYRLRELLIDLPDRLVALDVGAHVGNFSLALAKAAPNSQVYAFEASPSTARWLTRNVVANDLEHRVHVQVTALAGNPGELSFVDNAHGSAHNGLTAPTGTGESVTVPCLGFAEALHLAGGRVDLVKMDAEGAEFDVILHSDPSDWATVQAVVMEYHPLAGSNWASIVDFLATAGLDLTRDEPIAPGLGTAWFRRTA